MEALPVCSICNKLITSDLRIVKSKAILRIIDASKRRQDGKFKIIEKCSEVRIRINCHGNYIRDRCIQATERSVKKTSNSKRGAPTFDFKQGHFFCETDASNAYIDKTKKISRSLSDCTFCEGRPSKN
ncbi:unnamed protein product [Acanthoscelides obtectus]|uniref:Uncharacterized protein n=1 Tax=Acanthoscelides obtectus TaxID=200917 RepID=A0A9P0PFD7_ACAOB|nr:unnamed protein product [Acanthoscelides obtectus]CAK1656196.1 hypothetical protein AOBTE_LOCUS19610 [Acanthoscelides obtectus]